MAQWVENPSAILPEETQDLRVQSLVQEDAPEKEWQPTPVFLPGESHGQRRLTDYSPKVHKESDTTERLRERDRAYEKFIYWPSVLC